MTRKETQFDECFMTLSDSHRVVGPGQNFVRVYVS